MSQSKRRRVLAASRWREQVAREIAGEVVLVKDGGRFRASDSLDVYRRDDVRRWARRMLGGGLTFNVRAAREHAKALIALEDEQRVFEDWTRARGLGPESREPGAFDAYAVWQYAATLGLRDALIKHGWKCGEWTWVGPVKIWPMVYQWRGGWPGKLARQWPGDSRAPMGRAYARLGRRILDMLDARKGTMWEHAERQPSECQACAPDGAVVEVRLPTDIVPRTAHGEVTRARKGQRLGVLTRPSRVVGDDGQPRMAQPGEVVHVQCPDCHGTGHNLRGVLPAVEWPAQMVRKAVDSDIAASSPDCKHRGASHLVAPYSELRNAFTYPWGDKIVTRVVARGEQWDIRRKGPDDGTEADVRISKRGWYSFDGPATNDRLPGWLRGHLRHAEQRRERALRARVLATMRSVARGARGGTMADILAVPGVTGAQEDRVENAIRVQVTGETREDIAEIAARIQDIAPATVRIIIEGMMTAEIRRLEVHAVFDLG